MKILEADDSSFASLTELFIFEKNRPILDTFANFDGEFNLILSKRIRKIVFRNGSDYPLTSRRGQLLKKEKIYLKRSEILKKSGGMGYDKKYTRKQMKLLVDILKWNHKVGVDSVSFGIGHPDDVFYYNDLNVFKTKLKHF